jgi:energy-coupling factor transporter ATP-binding protein EcfA2
LNHLKVNGKNIQLPEVAAASILAIETKAADDGIYLDGFLNFLKDFHSCDNGTMVNLLYVTQNIIIPDHDTYQTKTLASDYIAPLEKAMKRIEELFAENTNYAVYEWYDEINNLRSLEDRSYYTMRIDGIMKECFAERHSLDSVESNNRDQRNNSFHYAKGYDPMLKEFFCLLSGYINNTQKGQTVDLEKRGDKIQSLIKLYAKQVLSGCDEVESKKVEKFYKKIAEIAEEIRDFNEEQIKKYFHSKKEEMNIFSWKELKLSSKKLTDIIDKNLDLSRAISLIDKLPSMMAISQEVGEELEDIVKNKKQEFQMFQENMKRLSELINEGNERIQVDNEEAILLLGNTGSGKSTIAHLLTGHSLKAIKDKATNLTKIEAAEPLDNIRISHDKTSETKIPNKCLVDGSDLVIWDCPGFNDTDVVQEIANSFYIDKLISTTKRLKFVLVASEASIMADRGQAFIKVVGQLANSFKSIKPLAQSVSLVISSGDSSELKTEIIKFLTQNKAVSNDVKEMLKYLLENIYYFNKPQIADHSATIHLMQNKLVKDPNNIALQELLETLISDNGNEQILPKSNLLAGISHASKFVENDAVASNMSLSATAQKYARALLDTSCTNLNQLLPILKEAMKNSGNSLQIGSNIFTKSCEVFERFLPESLKKFNITKHSKNVHFLEIDQLYTLNSKFKMLDLRSEEFVDLVKFVQSILDVFKDFVVDEPVLHSQEFSFIRHQIANYSYVLNQQIEYIKFFQLLTHQEDISYQKSLRMVLNNGEKDIAKNLEQKIKVFELNYDDQRTSYFKQAIKYLEIFQEDKKSVLKIAKIHDVLGDIYSDREKVDLALEHYLKAVKFGSKLVKDYQQEFNKTLAETYCKIADILIGKEDYIRAIEFYKVADQKASVKFCYDKLIGKSPKAKKLELLEQKGDYLAEIGEFSGATKSYNKASDLTYEQVTKKLLMQKVDSLLPSGSQIQIIIADHQKQMSNDQFYKFELIPIDYINSALDQLIGNSSDIDSCE